MISLEELEQYHASNPHVFEMFERFTFQVIGTGRKYFGAAAIMERIRWETQIEANSEVTFKVNDHQKAFYSRLFEKNHPTHKGFFRKRRSCADFPTTLYP